MQQIFTLGERGGVDTSPLFRFVNRNSSSVIKIIDAELEFRLMIMIENKIEELLIEKFKEGEFQDCFLIEINMLSKKMIEITLDADEGLTLEKCQRISRHVENWLDTEGVMGEDYTIEVSSPGVSRSLVYPRQYTKHIGRTLEVTCKSESPDTEGVKYEGKLQLADNQSITLEYEEVRKEGKKKIKETIVKTLPFEKIDKSFVKISFK